MSNRSAKERKGAESTRDELLAEIRDLRRRSGRPLTVWDITRARQRGELSAASQFYSNFGSLHLAIAEAGAGREPLDEKDIEKRRKGGRKFPQSAEGKLAEKNRMITHLRELHAKLGQTPKAVDIDAASAKGEMLPFANYKRVFGDLRKALFAAGIPDRAPRRTDRETMIAQFKALQKKLERIPRSPDIKRAAARGETADIPEFLKEFGSIENVYNAAGLAVSKRTYTEKEITEKLRELTRRLGHLPRKRDIGEAFARGNFPSLGVLRSRYGTLSNACRVLRLDESADKTIDKLAYLRIHWTEDEIIESLRRLTTRLGRLPLYQEVDEASRLGETPATSTLENRFGSFGKACRKARLAELVPDLPPDWSKRVVKYTKKDVIRSLRDLAKSLGRVPTLRDIDEAARFGTCANGGRIKRKFGTIENARRAAGLYEMISKAHSSADVSRYRAKTRQYTEDETFDMLRRLTRRLGHVPTTAEIEQASKRRECPSIQYLKMRCGGVVRARELARLNEIAPLKHRVPRAQTKKEVIRYLRDLTERLGRIPYGVDVKADSQEGPGPSLSAIRNHFGTFKKALQAARLSTIASTVRYPTQAYTKKEIIESLQELTRRLGRVPRYNDVVAAAKEGACPGATTVARHFGSFTKAVKAARLD